MRTSTIGLSKKPQNHNRWFSEIGNDRRPESLDHCCLEEEEIRGDERNPSRLVRAEPAAHLVALGREREGSAGIVIGRK
jgi:hypothetical protein